MFEFRRLHYVIHAQLHAPLSFRLDGLLIISMKLKATDVGILCIVCGVSHNNATHSLHTYCFANFY